MDAPPVMGLPGDTTGDDINHIQLLKTILVLNVAILIGFSLHEALVEAGLKLPLFVACLLCAIALTNTVPRLFPQMRWPSVWRSTAASSASSKKRSISDKRLGWLAFTARR